MFIVTIDCLNKNKEELNFKFLSNTEDLTEYFSKLYPDFEITNMSSEFKQDVNYNVFKQNISHDTNS